MILEFLLGAAAVGGLSKLIQFQFFHNNLVEYVPVKALTLGISDTEKLIHGLLKEQKDWVSVTSEGTLHNIWEHNSGVRVGTSYIPDIYGMGYTPPMAKAFIKDDEGEWKSVETKQLDPVFRDFKDRRAAFEQDELGRALARRILAPTVLGGPRVLENTDGTEFKIGDGPVPSGVYLGSPDKGYTQLMSDDARIKRIAG